MCVRTIVLICFVVHTAASVSINLLYPASDHVLVAGQPLAVRALVSGLSSSFKVFVRVSYGDEMRQLALRPADTGLWIGDVSDLVGRCTPTGFPLTLRAVALSDSCNVPPDSSTMSTCSDAAAQEFTSSPICVHVVCGSSAHSCDSNRSCVADQPLHEEGCGGFINSVTNTGAPYISVVLSGRNDEAMGDFTGRVQAFIDHFSIAAWAMNMSAEIIVVEWNPPAARPALASILKSGAPHNRLPVFIASVSPALHARLSKASSTEFFEYAAKNVGIRLARGSWILVGNPDSLFTLPMLTFLSLRRLTPGHFYRAHRDNIGRGQWPSIGSRPWLQQPFGRLAQLEARSQFSLHWSSMEGGRQLVSDSSVGTCSFGHVPSSRQLLHAAQSTDQPYAVAPGDFLIADSSTWNALGAYPDIINTAFLDYLQPCRMVGAGLKEVVIEPPCMLQHTPHPAPWVKMRLVSKVQIGTNVVDLDDSVSMCEAVGADPSMNGIGIPAESMLPDSRIICSSSSVVVLPYSQEHCESLSHSGLASCPLEHGPAAQQRWSDLLGQVRSNVEKAVHSAVHSGTPLPEELSFGEIISCPEWCSNLASNIIGSLDSSGVSELPSPCVLGIR